MAVLDRLGSCALSDAGPSFLGGQNDSPLPHSWGSCSTGRSHGAAGVVLYHDLSTRPPTDLAVVNCRLLGADCRCEPCRHFEVRCEPVCRIVITRCLPGADRFVKSLRGACLKLFIEGHLPEVHRPILVHHALYKDKKRKRKGKRKGKGNGKGKGKERRRRGAYGCRRCGCSAHGVRTRWRLPSRVYEMPATFVNRTLTTYLRPPLRTQPSPTLLFSLIVCSPWFGASCINYPNRIHGPPRLF